MRAVAEGVGEADWRPLANTILTEAVLDPGLTDASVALDAGIWKSEIGPRVRRARAVIYEVPFALPGRSADFGLDGASEAAVLRGVIDLAFREPEGLGDRRPQDRRRRR